MRFACLGYINEKTWNAISKSEREVAIKECLAYDDELLKDGHWIDGGQALQSAQTAKTLRWRDGQLLVTDGPYAETEEQLGGLGVLEAGTMAQAVALISRHPGLRLGPFEIRPIDEPMGERCKAAMESADTTGEGMKFMCLAYGDDNNWNALSPSEQNAMIED